MTSEVRSVRPLASGAAARRWPLCLVVLALVGSGCLAGPGDESAGDGVAEERQDLVARPIIPPWWGKVRVLWHLSCRRPSFDANGDGFGDVAIGGQLYSKMRLYHGSRSGLPASAAVAIDAPGPASDIWGPVSSAGDVNGDGYDDLIVGANAAGTSGRAYVYHGSSSGIRSSVKRTLSPPAGGLAFGHTVAGGYDLNDDRYDDVVVSALGSASAAGRVHVYLGSASGVGASPAHTLSGSGEVNANFGYDVAVGYFDGDALPDLAVSEHQGYGALGVGRVYVFMGKAGGLDTTAATTLTCPDGSKRGFGVSIDAINDFDGDGYGDLAVGAYGVGSNDGRVYIYRGGSAGLSTSPAVTLSPTAGTGGYFGYQVAAGDFDGDLHGDLVVGETDASGLAGRAHVYYGGPLPYVVDASSHAVLAGTHTGTGYFGNALAVSDLDGDGFQDALVGAPAVSSSRGAVYVFYGSESGLDTSPALTISGPDGVDASFGYFLSY